MFCVKCGKEISDYANFCNHCGAKVPVPERLPEGVDSAEMQARQSEAPTCGMAIASLICGCSGLFCAGITAIVGLGLGIASLSKINRSRGALGGHGVAIAGIAVSAAMIALLPIMAAVCLPAFVQAREGARRATCATHLQQISVGIQMYAQDNGGHLPLGENWYDAIQPYVREDNAFRCPSHQGDGVSYAYNAQLSGYELSRIEDPSAVVMLFDSAAGRNASGGFELADPRHQDGINRGYVDGHVYWEGWNEDSPRDPFGQLSLRTATTDTPPD